mgnify:CR=1 FL=1
MPFILIDTIATAEFASHNLIELTANNIKGIGFYANLSEAFEQNVKQRCLGFLACVTGDDAGVYQYTGASLDDWAQVDNWSVLGASDSVDGTESSYTLDLETTMILGGKYDTSSSNPFLLDWDRVPSTFEVRFSGAAAYPYDIETRGLHPDDPQFSQSWTHGSGPLSSFDAADVLPGQVGVRMRASWGTEFEALGHAGGFGGLSSDALAVASTGSWTAGSTAADELIAFLNGLPPAGLTMNWLYVGDHNESPLYLLYDRLTVNSATISADPAYWTPLNATPLTLQVTKNNEGDVTPGTDQGQRIIYPDTKRIHSATDGFNTVGDLSDMRFVITAAPEFVTFAEDFIAQGVYPEIDFSATISVEL